MSNTVYRPGVTRPPSTATDEPCCPGAARGRCKVGCPGPKPRPLGHRRSPIPDGLDTQEWHTVAHLRGWCHDSTKCPLCTAQDNAFRAKANARTEELRRIDAEINNAHLARELADTQEKSRFWMERSAEVERTLDSIIEG